MTTADDLLRRVQQFLDNGDLTGEALRLSIAVDEYLDAPKDDKAAPTVALTDVPETDFGMKDEPVAWKLIFRDGHTEITSRPVAEWKKAMWESAGKRWETYPLYLHPPTKTAPMKPMTIEEIQQGCPNPTNKDFMEGFWIGARYTEDRHGITALGFGGSDE